MGILMVMAAAAPALAGQVVFEQESEGPKPEVTLNYWSAVFHDGNNEADQKFFLPSLTAAANFTGPWTGKLEYHDSDSRAADNGTRVDSRRFALCVQYNFEGNYYATFGYQKMEYNLATAGAPWGIDVGGVRIGAGYRYVPDEEPWTGELEFGVGVTNNADVNSIAGTSEKVDADTYDILLRVKYKLNEDGTFANAGYKYVSTRQNIQRVAKTFLVKGPFLGIGYEW